MAIALGAATAAITAITAVTVITAVAVNAVVAVVALVAFIAFVTVISVLNVNALVTTGKLLVLPSPARKTCHVRWVDCKMRIYKPRRRGLQLYEIKATSGLARLQDLLPSHF